MPKSRKRLGASAPAGIVPSFILKLGRAEKHLDDLDVALAAYSEGRPYEVRETLEGKPKVKTCRMHFTRSTETVPEIALCAADAIYNMRSALDHLIASLVPPKERRRSYFPIYFEGVWEAGIPGENEEIKKARGRWRSLEEALGVDHPALAILKSLQPPKERAPGELHRLSILNSLSNTDRHRRLPVFPTGLVVDAIVVTRSDGRAERSEFEVDGRTLFKDGAKISRLPDGVVNVELEATALVAVDVADQGSFPLSSLRGTLELIRRDVLRPLQVFVVP